MPLTMQIIAAIVPAPAPAVPAPPVPAWMLTAKRVSEEQDSQKLLALVAQLCVELDAAAGRMAAEPESDMERDRR